MNKRLVGVGLVVVFGAACGGGTSDICKGRKAGDVVITELMLDPEGVDTGSEWIELYNTLGTALDLKGMTINYKDTDGSGAKSHTIRAGSIPSQNYLAMGDVRSGANPAWIGYSYADGLGALGNARGVVTLKCGTLVIDEVTYTRPAKPYRSRALDPAKMLSSVANDDESNWCDTDPNAKYFGNNAGTPGQPNLACPSGPGMDGGTDPDMCFDSTAGFDRAVVRPVVGDLVISEFMASPLAAGTGEEWFEVLAKNAVDLNGVSLKGNSGTATVSNAECVPATAGSYVLFAHTADPAANGNITPVVTTFSFALANSNGSIHLLGADGGTLDDVTWTAAVKSGVSRQLDTSTLDPDLNNFDTNFCDSTQNIVLADGGLGDKGTPGMPNTGCSANPDAGNDGGMTDAGDPSQCFDTGLGAARAIVRPVAGDLVVTEFMANPLAAGTTAEWFEVLAKNTVDLNGVGFKGNTATGMATIGGSNCVQADAGSYLLFAHTADPATNGNIAPTVTTFTFSLANTNGSLHVVGADGGVLDDVTWTNTVKSAISRQLDPGKLDNVMNDVETSFCNSDAGFLLLDGGPSDVGTPGQPNRPCQ